MSARVGALSNPGTPSATISNNISLSIAHTAGMDAQLPIFSVQKAELQFSIASDFVAAQVANNVLILALQSGRIMRIDLESPADIDGVYARA